MAWGHSGMFLGHQKTRRGVGRGGGDGETLPSGIGYGAISENTRMRGISLSSSDDWGSGWNENG